MPLPTHALFGTEEMWTGTVFLLPSWTVDCTNKWSGGVTPRMRRGITVPRWGPNSVVSHKKERDVHTKTSTTVLFVRGANLETTSKCLVAGKGAGGADYREPLCDMSLGVGQRPSCPTRGCLQPRRRGRRLSPHPQSVLYRLDFRLLIHSHTHSFIDSTNAD